MNAKIMISGILAFLLILSGCGKESVHQVSNKPDNTSRTQQLVSNEKTNSINKEPGSTLIEDQQKAIDEISKNNKMTKEEMLKIAHQVVVDSFKKYYTLKSDEEVTSWVNTYFLDPSIFLENYKKDVKENNPKIKFAEVISENERVAPYGENGFTFKTRMTFVENLKSGESKKYIYEETFVIRKDDKDGKYKISTMNGVEVPQ